MASARKRYVLAALTVNCATWVYFWISFLLHARPYTPTPEGFHAPLSPVTVFGYSIGLLNQLSEYFFMNVTLIAEFPSFLLAGALRVVLFPEVTRDWSFAGTDLGGYFILAVMLLSFLQWYCIGRVLAWLIPKLRKGATF